MYNWVDDLDGIYDLLGDTKQVAPETKNAEGKATHRATYARDKRTAGFNIRVVGPQSNEFAGEEVPVETKAGGEPHMEKLTRLLWTGDDKDPETGALTGRKAALYAFEARPREVNKPTW
jgi:hypothetical protein